ncbi:hypothetical protein PsorP6_004976 [Peronosclerospora sorghi]|uniref:Uncharacterized protein n=1 Tax=Peronosclerospora sorghi TaxID=230839 RepID=A0ACC0W4D5_9STRA|nr:hypothetical protein PsorP6_004976 [Peronosclerospora sorghi]
MSEQLEAGREAWSKAREERDKQEQDEKERVSSLYPPLLDPSSELDDGFGFFGMSRKVVMWHY